MRPVRRRRSPWSTRLAAGLALALAGAPALRAQFRDTATAESSVRTTRPTKAKLLADPSLVVPVGIAGPQTVARCRLEAANRGKPRKGVKAIAVLQILDPATGDTLLDLGRVKKKTRASGVAEFPVPLDSLRGEAIGLVAGIDIAGNKKATDVVWRCEITDIPAP